MGEEQLRLILKNYISQLKEQYALPIGGVADYYTEAKTVIELASAVNGAIAAKLPYLVVGAGNRVLFSDGGYPGLLIRNMSGALMRSTDRSQVVVDSGVLVNRLVTQTVSWELGGLTPFFGQTATVGGALYNNLTVSDHRFAATLRSVTILVPPTKLTPEAKIIRQPASWLFNQAEEDSRLRRLAKEGEGTALLPIILTANLQLTSNRGGELLGQIRRSSQLLTPVPRNVTGPLFVELPNGALSGLLKGVSKGLRIGDCRLYKGSKNYAETRGKMRASDLRQLITTIEQRVLQTNGVNLISRYEYLGVW